MNRALLILFCLLSPLAGAVADPGPRCGGEAASPGNLQLQVGKSSMLRLPEAVQQRSVGNPAVVQAMLVAPDTLYVVGVEVGSTNMIIQGRSGVCSVVNVSVSMDPAGLQTTLAALMPEEKAIRVTAVADTLVLSGTVQDAGAVLRAVELAHAYVRRATVPLALPKPADGAAMPLAATAPGGGAGGAHSRIINMLDVSAPQQVMLAVQIAEVSKSLLERLEVGATLRFASGSWATTLLSNFLSGTANGLLDVRKSNGRQQLTIEAQKQDGLVRILAEPTVMAISGQEGSFLAGGKIFIPVGQDNNKITLEEREYGVGLRFTPTVLSGGRINLKVAPEVSELSREGVGISAAGVSGRSILPVITTRRASTTVQLYDGQSYAIGGLIKNNQVSNITGVPWLSEVPILGALFRSTDFQNDRTELLFVITAHLVKPLPADAVLPTAQLAQPSRMDLMLGGKMEGTLAPPSVPPSVPAPRAANGFELK
ncbi:type II and III secretion system protein family protein [Janthinobacterium sp. BJB401]|uniref:type II and III secretion system protein family protein n=1 Tax=Janthinobacterium sp. BJB401 TaxID=2745934 RepID=UPI0015952A0E|nr:type II and III secretion system protein family protein [Janthinobacterium sp. BJB401]NVI83951.1 type II and III secretion system protein family protein [Janthinobacterium sp. BJB401]